MSYLPPSSPLTFSFTEGGYSPLSSPLTANFVSAGTISPFGIDSAEFGDSSVFLRDQYVYPSPIVEGWVGSPEVERQQIFFCEGFDPSAFGSLARIRTFSGALLNFTEPAEAPDLPLVFNFIREGQVSAPGLASLASGVPRVYNFTEELRPFGVYELAFGQAFMVFDQERAFQGFDALATGLASVANASQGVIPAGFSPLAFGVQSLSNLDIAIDLFGFDTLEMGFEHLVDYYLSECYPSGFDAAEWGDTWVSNQIRTYYFAGIDALVFGETTIYNQTSTIYPLPIPAGPVGTPAVGFNVAIYPLGFDSSEHGATEVFDNSQRIPMSGFLSEQFGLGFLRREFDFLEGVTLNQALSAGEPYVTNLNQFIAPQPPESEPEDCGIPTVTNYDREVYPQAFEALRFGLNYVLRGLPPITPEGLATLEAGTPWVSNEIRSIFPPGSEMLLFDAQRVENDADALYPSGFEALAVAGPYVWQNLQTINDVRVGETWALGAPFLADRIRTLGLEGAESLEAGRPAVFNWHTYVRPAGWDSYRTSTTIVRDKAIRVRVDVGIQPGLFGEPGIANRNRSVFPFGPLTEGMSGPRLELFRRPIYPLSIYDFAMGDSLRVEFLDREIRPTSFIGRMGNGSVFNWPQPPGQQQILPFGIDGLLIAPPEFSNNVIEPSGFDALAFGSALVRGTLLQPTGINSFDYGIPAFVVTQYIYADDIRAQDLYGKPQMSPLTVWAPYGAPPQAIANHGGGGNVIGYLEYPNEGADKIPFGDRCTWFGSAQISNFIRSLFVIGADMARYGEATVTSPGVIFIYPQGFNAFRTSFHEILGGDKTLAGVGFDAQLFGLHSVSFPPDFTITTTVPGFDATEWGTAWVSSRPQNLWTLGADSSVFGGPSNPTYSGLWVSREYDPFPIPGFDAAALGEPWVSNYLRSIGIEGFDALEVDETPPNPRARIYGSARLLCMGADSSSFGAAWVSLGAREIGAFSVFHHPALPSPIVRGQSKAHAIGVESATLGEPMVDYTEPGKVKTRGEDSSAFGLAKIQARIFLASITGEVGSPGVGPAAGVQGFESLEIGDSAVVGDGGHTCGSAARAIVAQGVMTEEMGEPALA